MTALRPEHDAGREASYEQGAYGAAGAFEAAVDQLADPLNDPLPGQERPGAETAPGATPEGASPWFRSSTVPQGQTQGPGAQAVGYGQRPYEPLRQPGPAVPGQHAAGQQVPRQAAPQQAAPGQHVPPQAAPRQPPQHLPGQPGAVRPAQEAVQAAQQPLRRPQEPYGGQGRPGAGYGGRTPAPAPAPAPEPTPAPVPASVPTPVYDDETYDDETVALRTDDTRRIAAAGPQQGTRSGPPPVTGGRAERRRAAKGRGSRGKGPERKAGSAAEAAPEAPLSRVEARRAARAAKDSPAVVASRFFGEMFISLGVLMLLFVTYQLWWTNVRADLFAGKEADKIQEGWANGRGPGAFEPGQGFAIMHIPKLDVVVPIAEGIDKKRVLDNGMVGHYAEGELKTAMPSDKQGNFAVAGHRNTHGEPFRYINQLEPGDPIVVETQDTYYTYEMASILPQTAPSNVSVIRPVPPGSGFTRPGRYITLTTCTPEFTSTYRMIVWGKMVDERPRSKGQPDALVG
ncbi:hypothetical protein GCM10010346_45460 [Streptomyces chryseus]|uniref:Class E sortase n=2 Tax=Streptomyces chryseus TaxID=68186 RepID=A0ABQ3DUV8_9ACTN|nr:class E sortase [Streptomyces chryseus]GHB16498.1 hypothetical protein GCM10010346_45460 [Streptomyces chryseus]